MIGLKAAKDRPAKSSAHLIGIQFPESVTAITRTGSIALVLLLLYNCLKLWIVLFFEPVIPVLSSEQKDLGIVGTQALTIAGFGDGKILLPNIILFAALQHFQIDLVQGPDSGGLGLDRFARKDEASGKDKEKEQSD